MHEQAHQLVQEEPESEFQPKKARNDEDHSGSDQPPTQLHVEPSHAAKQNDQQSEQLGPESDEYPVSNEAHAEPEKFINQEYLGCQCIAD